MSKKSEETKRIMKRLGFIIPPLWLCECDDVTCREILFNGRHFVNGHNGRVPNIEAIKKMSEGGKKGIKFAAGWNKGLTKETDSRVAKNGEAIKEALSFIDMSKSEEEKLKMSESHKKWLKIHDHPMLNKTHKQESKELMKESQQKRVNSPDYVNPFFGKLPSIKCNRSHGDWYRTPNQRIKFLRSQWEIKYAKYLDSQNISWFYEFKSFHMNIGKESIYAPNGKDTTYHPDFWIPSLNKFIEIKGRDNYEDWNNNDDPKLKSDKFKNEFCKEWSYEVLFRDNLKLLGFNLNIKEPKFIFMTTEEEELYTNKLK